MLRAEFDVSGPIFDGRAEAAIVRFEQEASDAVAQLVVDDIKRTIQESARSRTGNYENHVTTNRAATSTIVTDQRIVYGPWLEGVSERNDSTPFKGYAAFRRAKDRLSDSPDVRAKVEGVLERFRGEME